MCLCSHHWILAMIYPKEGKIFILDPLDVNESTYNKYLQQIFILDPLLHKSCYNYNY
jgi:hypothetical protein